MGFIRVTNFFLLAVVIGQVDSVKWSSSDASETAKDLLELGSIYSKFQCLLHNNCVTEDKKYLISAQHQIKRHETALLMLLGFGGISLILAVLYNSIRKNVFQEKQSVDRTFDAGGNVSTSLTSVTVASQLLWPADLLQGATVTARIGIAGPFWYTVGAAVNIALFPIMSAQLKTRAPGAKTYPQIMFARYGKAAHLVYCIFALMVNVVILANLLVAGVMAIQSVTVGATPEFCVLIIATLFGSYSFIGGLGTTFYVSYFNILVIYVSLIILIGKVFYFPDGTSSEEKFRSVYDQVKSLSGPEGNEERSLFTFHTIDGAIFGIAAFCLTSSITYCDQASWQSRIAAKPLQGVIGFFIATFMWFAIPSSIAATTGIVYLSYTTINGTGPLLSDLEIDSGMVTPYVAQAVLGSAGSFLVLTMMGMALMSTGSGEVMAVSSIIVYDIYQTHIAPFRKNHKVKKCILCDKDKRSDSGGVTQPIHSDHIEEVSSSLVDDHCTCPVVSDCEYCGDDTPTPSRDQKKNTDYSVQRMYLCPFHGPYRVYQDKLNDYKSWCILWVTIGLVPFGMLVDASGMDLTWSMFVGCILTIPGLPGVILTILWSKTTGPAVIAGSLTGLVVGISSTLGMASTFDGGLSLFFKNTAQPYALLAGSGGSLVSSLLVNIFVSLVTHKIKTQDDADNEWRKLRAIDNPLSPWSDLFRDDIPDLAPNQQPTTEQVDKLFRKPKIVSVIGGIFIIVLFIVIIPSVMTSLHVLTFEEFMVWTRSLHVWCLLMAVVVVVFAPVEEILQITKQIAINKSKRQKYLKDNMVEEFKEMKKKDIVTELKEKQDAGDSRDYDGTHV